MIVTCSKYTHNTQQFPIKIAINVPPIKNSVNKTTLNSDSMAPTSKHCKFSSDIAFVTANTFKIQYRLTS